MSEKFTPGPWQEDELYVCAFVDGKECTLCECFNHFPMGVKGASANVRLIAAAPELYAALERTLNWLSSYPAEACMGVDGPYEQARAALAKVSE